MQSLHVKWMPFLWAKTAFGCVQRKTAPRSAREGSLTTGRANRCGRNYARRRDRHRRGRRPALQLDARGALVELEHAWQDRFEAVALADHLLGRPAHRPGGSRVAQHVDRLRGQLIGVEEVRDQTVLA